MQLIFNGPDGFVLATRNLDENKGIVNGCYAITNGLVCADGTNYQADSFFYQCKNNDGTCPTDNLSVAVSSAKVVENIKRGLNTQALIIQS